jgi:excisionase family DNA binding protein
MEYLTVAQVAEELGLSARGVRNRIERGALRAEQINARLLLVPRAEVERWKARGRLKAGQPPAYSKAAVGSTAMDALDVDEKGGAQTERWRDLAARQSAASAVLDAIHGRLVAAEWAGEDAVDLIDAIREERTRELAEEGP